MSLHSTLFAGAGLGQLLRTQGESITWTDGGGTETPLTALVSNKRAPRHDRRPQGTTYEHERTFQIARDTDSPFGGLAAAQTNATITYAGESYAVLGIESEDVSSTTVLAGYVGLAERSGPEHRGRF